MAYETLEIDDARGVRTVWLNRPERRNAMNDILIRELNEAIDAAIADAGVRVIMLAGRGEAFCAGADLNWMKSGRQMSNDESSQDAGGLAHAMRALYQSPKPTIARVHGSAFAGAMGLVGACDLAVGSEETRFCLSEVKLGLLPAMISPYVIRAIGERHARRLMLTAEVFQAPMAQRLGLLHESVPRAELDGTVARLIDQLLLGSPTALGETKRLIRDVVGKPIDDDLTAMTAARIGAARTTDDAQEGITAFFEKRKPRWVPKAD
ncbi:MAG: enoyl-CoA hydratase/isomerase family protein [Burkholderiaceae bacterium]